MSKQPPKPMPIDFEEVDFSIEREFWNEYELKDGVIIRGRIFLTKIIRDPYNPKEFQFNLSKPVWVVYAPPHLRGDTNMKMEGNQIMGKKFEVIPIKNDEPWNVYTILKTGQKLKIKLTISEISQFEDVFDEHRMPIYDVPSGAAVNMSKENSNQKQ